MAHGYARDALCAGVSKWSKSYQGHDDGYGAQMAYDFYASENPAKANLGSLEDGIYMLRCKGNAVKIVKY